MGDYYLQADLFVPEANKDAFEKVAAEFVARGSFKFFGPEFDYDLVLGLRSVSPAIYAGYLETSPQPEARAIDRSAKLRGFQYVNVWSMPSLADLDLAKLMRRSADDDVYRLLNSLVVEETQEIVYRVRQLGDSPSALPVNEKQKRFVRATRRFQSKDLGTYLFDIGALLPSLELKGWHALGQFQSVTGALNTVTEFWQTTDGAPELEDALKDLPKALVDTVASAITDLPEAQMREVFARATFA